MEVAPKVVNGSPSRSELLTVKEVAELLKVPVSWVYERTRQRGLNRLRGFRLGKYWRFLEEEVFAWLEQQRVGGHANA
jgi:excisionase family DNA binding protein